MNAIKNNTVGQQGIAFCALAVVFSGLSVRFPVWNPGLETLVLAAFIFCLGVPHGALDVVFAKRLYALVTWSQWAIFCVAYLAVAAAVVGFWWVFPSAFLPVFLLVSAFHFSGDLNAGTSPLLRFWYAGSMLVFPAWFHEEAVASLFNHLVAGASSAQLAAFLNALALPWCVGLCSTLALRRDCWSTQLEVLSVALLAAVATPLLGFTVFFCAMHSARHAIRVRAYAPDTSWLDMLKNAAGPMLFCAVAVAMLWPSQVNFGIDAAVLRVLFVGLAALTVPHMVLIEQIRMSNWQLARQ